ncbi:MAG: rhodanese-like domain-containing protein [Bacteroidota bacterium]
MKPINILWILVFSAILGACNTGNKTKESENIRLISPQEMQELLELENVQLIDVRSVEDFREAHLINAQSLVYDDEFIENIKQLDKSKPVAVYCRTGRRSDTCSKILEEQGFEKIYQLEGGIEEWQHQNMSVESE